MPRTPPPLQSSKLSPPALTGRSHTFQAVSNFRDYGGYSLSGGRRIRDGLLYRSAHLAAATDTDLKQLAKLDISTIVDLRGKSERALAPSRQLPEFAGTILEGAEETGGLLGPLLLRAKQRAGGLDVLWLMTEGYATMPFRWRLKNVLKNYFRALYEADGRPVLVHCMAGKDRTGLVVALLHEAMGVHRDDIVADYMLTNLAGNPDLKGGGPNSIRTTFNESLSDEQVRILSSVREEFIIAALTSIESRYGNVHVYLEKELNVPARWIHATTEKITK